jgi:Pectate lyase superfamily protein
MVESGSRREFLNLSATSFIGVAANSVAAPSTMPPNDKPKNLPKAPFTSVKEFGALGDGIADDSACIKQAYDSLKPTGGTLFFPRGRYRMSLELTSRNVHVVGEGRGASILCQISPTSTVIRALYREGSWDAVTIADLTLKGVGNNEGNGFAAGGDTYQPLDEYTGSTFFSRVQFANFDKCLLRPFGSIGLWVDGCQFGAANYHIWARSVLRRGDRDEMHSGCVVVSRCHMDYFTKAMFYLDSPSGDCGQIIFENNIFEGGSGFVIYIRSFNSSGGVPGMSFRNNWNENTATASNLVVEGKTHPKAKFLFAENATSAIRFEDTPIGDCQLFGSSVETRSCSLQNLTKLDADAGSTVVHDLARMFSGTSLGRVRTIAHPPSTEGLRTPWFRMPVPKGQTSLFKQQAVLRMGGNRPMTLVGASQTLSVTQPNLGVFDKDAAQLLSIGTSNDMSLLELATMRGSGWLVTSCIYKLLSGRSVNLKITGTTGISGIGELSSLEWEMLVNVSKFDFAAAERITTYFHSKGRSKLLVGGIALVAFNRLQDAVDYINAGLFPA